jgi:hypothetical protein
MVVKTGLLMPTMLKEQWGVGVLSGRKPSQRIVIGTGPSSPIPWFMTIGSCMGVWPPHSSAVVRQVAFEMWQLCNGWQHSKENPQNRLLQQALNSKICNAMARKHQTLFPAYPLEKTSRQLSFHSFFLPFIQPPFPHFPPFLFSYLTTALVPCIKSILDCRVMKLHSKESQGQWTKQ